jgi:hypothetical protein
VTGPVRCDLSDLPVDQCACRVHGPAETPSDGPPPGLLFEAKFPGRCTSCGERIEPGDLITADGRGGYICEEDVPR